MTGQLTGSSLGSRALVCGVCGGCLCVRQGPLCPPPVSRTAGAGARVPGLCFPLCPCLRAVLWRVTRLCWLLVPGRFPLVCAMLPPLPLGPAQVGGLPLSPHSTQPRTCWRGLLSSVACRGSAAGQPWAPRLGSALWPRDRKRVSATFPAALEGTAVHVRCGG